MSLLQFWGSIELGLIYGLVAIAGYLTFRVIGFSDLTVDGSFLFGAAIVTTLIAKGIDPRSATVAAILGGSLSGLITGILVIRFRILPLFAGILTMTALYSVSLRVMRRPNIALLDEGTLLSGNNTLSIISFIVFSVMGFLAWFLSTEWGLGIRATGINKRVSQAYGIRVDFVIVGMLILSNSIVALAGALFAQLEGFADISMGPGTVIVGLASVFLGESMFHSKKVIFALIGCLSGSILYWMVMAMALNTHALGLKASDRNILSALLVIIALILPQFKRGAKKRDLL